MKYLLITEKLYFRNIFKCIFYYDCLFLYTRVRVSVKYSCKLYVSKMRMTHLFRHMILLLLRMRNVTIILFQRSNSCFCVHLFSTSILVASPGPLRCSPSALLLLFFLCVLCVTSGRSRPGPLKAVCMYVWVHIVTYTRTSATSHNRIIHRKKRED